MPALTVEPARTRSTGRSPAGTAPTCPGEALRVGRQLDLPVVTAPRHTPLLTHVLHHGGFAEYDCRHCRRSYARAMARYDR